MSVLYFVVYIAKTPAKYDTQNAKYDKRIDGLRFCPWSDSHSKNRWNYVKKYDSNIARIHFLI